MRERWIVSFWLAVENSDGALFRIIFVEEKASTRYLVLEER